MDAPLLLTLVLAFAAVFAALEGVWMLWQGSRSAEARRLRERIARAAQRDRQARQVALLRTTGRHAGSVSRRAAGLGEGLDEGLKEGSARQRLQHTVERGLQTVERLIAQAGMELPAQQLVAWAAGGAAVAGLGTFILRAPAPTVWLAACAAGGLPVLIVLGRRRQRLARLHAQLPDAVDLMARAMRAGHALPAALQMVGEEAAEPLAGEFRIAHEEINLGLGLDEALRNLAARVPSDDLRFLVIAVLLQRETGGNLAEVLSRIATLVRSRFRLLGKVRVLAAEGKLSAWILALMPLVVGAALNLLNPAFMRPLWTDPLGVTLLQGCLGLVALGIVWMRHVVQIRV